MERRIALERVMQRKDVTVASDDGAVTFSLERCAGGVYMERTRSRPHARRIVPKCERQERAGQILEGHDMFGPTVALQGAGTSNAGRSGLSWCGRRQPRQADHSPRQVQDVESAAKGLAAPAPGRRARHRALEVRSPDGSLLAARRPRRCVALDQLRCRLQPALADEGDRKPGSGGSFFAPAARCAVAGADHASITWRLWPLTGLRLNSTLLIAISSRYATAMSSRMSERTGHGFCRADYLASWLQIVVPVIPCTLGSGLVTASWPSNGTRARGATGGRCRWHSHASPRSGGDRVVIHVVDFLQEL